MTRTVLSRRRAVYNSHKWLGGDARRGPRHCWRGRPSDERSAQVGLLDILDAVRVKKPAAVAAKDDPHIVHAPVSGRVVPLSEVGDPVFSQGMLG